MTSEEIFNLLQSNLKHIKIISVTQSEHFNYAGVQGTSTSILIFYKTPDGLETNESTSRFECFDVQLLELIKKVDLLEKKWVEKLPSIDAEIEHLTQDYQAKLTQLLIKKNN